MIFTFQSIMSMEKGVLPGESAEKSTGRFEKAKAGYEQYMNLSHAESNNLAPGLLAELQEVSTAHEEDINGLLREHEGAEQSAALVRKLDELAQIKDMEARLVALWTSAIGMDTPALAERERRCREESSRAKTQSEAMVNGTPCAVIREIRQERKALERMRDELPRLEERLRDQQVHYDGRMQGNKIIISALTADCKTAMNQLLKAQDVAGIQARADIPDAIKTMLFEKIALNETSATIARMRTEISSVKQKVATMESTLAK